MATDTLPAFDKRATLEELDRLRDEFGQLLETGLTLTLMERNGTADVDYKNVRSKYIGPRVCDAGKIVHNLARAGLLDVPEVFGHEVRWFHFLVTQGATTYGEEFPEWMENPPRWTTITDAARCSFDAVEFLQQVVADFGEEPAEEEEKSNVPPKPKLDWHFGATYFSFRGIDCELTDTPLRLLRYMVESKAKSFSRETLLAAVWSDTPVEPNVVNEAMSTVRAVLRTIAEKAQLSDETIKDPLPNRRNLGWAFLFPKP